MTESAVRIHISRGHAGTHIPPFFRIGRKVRWHREVVEQWLRAKAGLEEPVPKATTAEGSGSTGRVGRPTKRDKVEGRR
ncbi:hypothetical protein [Endothiovibrio diazotrophicus]